MMTYKIYELKEFNCQNRLPPRYARRTCPVCRTRFAIKKKNDWRNVLTCGKPDCVLLAQQYYCFFANQSRFLKDKELAMMTKDMLELIKLSNLNSSVAFENLRHLHGLSTRPKSLGRIMLDESSKDNRIKCSWKSRIMRNAEMKFQALCAMHAREEQELTTLMEHYYYGPGEIFYEMAQSIKRESGVKS